MCIYKYLQENNIEDIVHFQNPLSPHITLYYLEKDINLENEEHIKNMIGKINLDNNIYINSFNYFYKQKNDRFILFFTPKTSLNLKEYRNFFHKELQKDFVKDNNLEFIPHISFLKIVNSGIFEKHRKNIEEIIKENLQKIQNINCNTKNAFLYAVNSEFKEEIQIKV